MVFAGSWARLCPVPLRRAAGQSGLKILSWLQSNNFPDTEFQQGQFSDPTQLALCLGGDLNVGAVVDRAVLQSLRFRRRSSPFYISHQPCPPRPLRQNRHLERKTRGDANAILCDAGVLTTCLGLMAVRCLRKATCDAHGVWTSGPRDSMILSALWTRHHAFAAVHGWRRGKNVLDDDAVAVSGFASHPQPPCRLAWMVGTRCL